MLIDVQSATPISRTVTMALGNLAFNVEVVATTPLRGGDIESNEIPSPVQVATHVDIEQSGSLNVSDFLNRRFNPLHLAHTFAASRALATTSAPTSLLHRTPGCPAL